MIRLTVIKGELERLKEESDAGARAMARVELLTAGLGLRDVIINALSLEARQ